MGQNRFCVFGKCIILAVEAEVGAFARNTVLKEAGIWIQRGVGF
jgi:hypothetical protein